jgi:hypothetical protein
MYQSNEVIMAIWISSGMGKLQLTGQNLGPVFNSRSDCMSANYVFCYEAKQPNLQLKTWKKQLKGSLPIAFALPGSGLSLSLSLSPSLS